MIRAGKIGDVRTIIGNALSWKPAKLSVKEHGGGALFHDGTHLTDLLLFFGGPIDWVSGHDVRPHGKKFIEGGVARNYFNFELDIQGAKGRILIGNSGRELYITRKSGRFTGFQELKRTAFPKPKRLENPFTGGAKDMVRSVRTGQQSVSSGQDGLKALEVIMSIYESAQQNGRRIKIKCGKAIAD